MNTVTDLDIFFTDSDATMTVGAGEPFPIIFVSAGREVPQFDGSVMTTEPEAVVKMADVTANNLTSGTMVVIDEPSTGITAQTYYVAKIKPDGSGLAVVMLQTNDPAEG